MRLAGTTALVTGGTGGIGSATCARLAAEGAKVAVADLDLDKATALAGEIDGLGIRLDVTSTESARAAVGEIEEQLGPIAVLVNNAGLAEDDFFLKTDEGMWDRTLAVNLRGVFGVTHAVLPGMHERRVGSIINIASEAGRVGSQMSTIYSASKAGVIGFTKALAKESARYGVRVNAIAPGPIETPMMHAAEEHGDVGVRMVQGMVMATAMRRPGDPDEVAATIAFLASQDASFITGETIGVSGGLGMM